MKTRRASTRARNAQRIPPAFFALGQLMQGEGSSQDWILRRVTASLSDADRLLAPPYLGGAQRVPLSTACSTVFESIKKADVGDGMDDYAAICSHGSDPGPIMIEAIDRALFLGAALAYRYFQVGGAK